MRLLVLITLLSVSLSGFAQDKEAQAKEYFGKAINLDITGNKAEAILNYERALELNPDYTDALYNLGALYYNRGVEFSHMVASEKISATQIKNGKEANYKKAAEYFERLVALNENDVQTLNSLKLIYVALEEYGKADVVKKKLDAILGKSKKE